MFFLGLYDNISSSFWKALFVKFYIYIFYNKNKLIFPFSIKQYFDKN